MSHRIAVIDQLRGLVIVLMGLDHVRDFFSPFAYQPEDLSQTSPELFLTRWITHLCAPVFIFLTGMSAFLYEQKCQSKTDLRNFLITRGIWLIFIELVVVNASWKFGFPGWYFVQVIWAIGVSMLFLAVFIYLPKKLTFIFGLMMILGHNLLDGINPESFGDFFWLWGILHQPLWIPFDNQGAGLFVAYPLVPWIGVMMVGYAGAVWLISEADSFSDKTLKLGVLLTVAFVAIRMLNIYGDPVPWSEQERGSVYTFLSFLNTAKYPPSLAYLLMTLGPGLILLSQLDKLSQRITRPLLLFGRVPFFYYVVHLPIIHLLSILFFLPTLDLPVGWQLNTRGGLPEGYEPDMLRLYLVWLGITLLMYVLCRWFAGVKRRHDHWVLKYL